MPIIDTDNTTTTEILNIVRTKSGGGKGRYERIKKPPHSAFPCKKCGEHHLRKIRFHTADNKQSVHRKWECQSCGYQQTSNEHIEKEPKYTIWVVKRDELDIEPFSIDKLYSSMKRSTKVSSSHIASMRLWVIARSIQARCENQSCDVKVSSGSIREMVLCSLAVNDEVTFVHYCTTHMRFRNKAHLDELCDYYLSGAFITDAEITK